MAGRDKKLKNLQSDQAPTMSIKEQASDSKTQVTDVTTNSSSGADGESRKNGPLRPGRPKKFKKLARKHKLNAMPATSADTVVKAAARGRGRPPGSTNKRSTEVDRIPDDEVATDDPTAKTRGRKRISINETAETKPANETEPAKPNIAKEGDVKKTVKGVTKKVTKKKLFVAKKGVGKKKVLLSKKILKGVSKQVDPKVLKKNLSAKLKSASEKIELKKETVESPVAEKADVEVSPIPDIKELEIAETPTSVPNSRSSSPKTCKRARTSSDVSSNKNDSGTKSPYSTRSERSSPHMMEPAQKLLRNGKQRKAKNALLTETVDQEFKKRRRLMSDSRDSKSSDVGSDIDDIKKVKRLRSYSRDGSEISKCSDTTDFDISFNDTIDSDKPELKDVTKVQEEVKSNGELDSPDESVSDKIVSIKSEEITPTEDTITEVKSNSLDNENNNTDTNDKTKTDSLVFSEKSAGSEATSPVTEANKGPETLSEKSLILDNMSKTFNESSLSEKAKSIRRSARQRKITVKAKEHEESVLAEKDAIEAELRLKTAKVEPDGSISKSPNSKLTKKDDAATSDTESPKITKNESDTEKEKPTEKNDLPDDAEDPEKANETEENLKLLFEEEEETDATQVPIDESLKENIETPLNYQAIDKLMVKLKNFEEQDKKRQEEKAAEKHVMVTNDVVLISKSNNEQKPLKDIPNTIKIDKSMDKDVLSCFENNSAISIVKKDQIRKSVDVDTPSVTLIKKTGATRKLSTSSNDAVTLIDKTLGKEISLDIRKSIEKALVTPETKQNSLTSVNNQAVTISVKSQGKDSPAVKSSKKDSTKPEKDATKSEKDTSKTDKETLPKSPEEASQKVQEAETVSVALDPPEKQKQKEIILRHLGLLTHEAAKKAKLDKQKQRETYAKQFSKNALKMMDSGYTGTLKTIIKLNRSPDKKKSRSPLKMTFQKSKGRGSKAVSDSISGSDESDDNPHYTIHKDSGGSSGAGSTDGHPLSGGHRKSHYSNRLNNDSGLQDPLNELALELMASGKEGATNLVIPEKASSFGIHPDRLCQDQCFYCGGKFGLFDTPCHIAQIKSLDRQKKILDCEEKLSVDSCLCDACYRHVDRRANCPSYRKRAGPGALLIPPPAPGNARDTCHVTNCMKPAPQTLRRKWLVKMKKSISKVVNLNLDYLGLQTIPLCVEHYQAISHLMVCGLCKKGLSKNHIHYISQVPEYQSLNPLLKEQGIPVVFSEKPIVCKACRVFCTLLIRPSQDKSSSDFFSSHRRRLLQSYNINVPEESEKDSHNNDELIASAFIKEHNDSIKDKKKSKNGKAKAKKGSDNGKSTDENNSSIILNLNKEKGSDEWKNKSSQNKSLTMEEDIESLISSNKIPVPNSNPSSKASSQTKNSDSEETLVEYDNPLISAIDSKQYEYILQKCKNFKGPGMIQKKPNLTQKSKNILKAQNAPAISKVSAQQKIMEKNAKRIQKLGQIITRPENMDQSNDTSDIGVDKILGKDLTGLSILKNIQLNDECTIETIPPKACKPVDTNSMKMKWQLSNSYTQIKKNLNALSKNLDGQVRKKNVGNNESSFSNPVKRLETNPSISVRELFPGEEEMNLHCTIDFGNIKGVTPEGWEKCNSTIQYDSVTKKLWHELQKPYGNQSSFLRHLILLEKYYRNGDLVLSPNANTNAATYSESVQNRLRAYDNIPSSHANGDLSNHGLTAFLKNSSVTLIPHVVPSPPPAVISEHVPEVPKKAESHSNSLIEFRKQKSQKTNSGKSLLKTNQLDGNRSLPTKLLPKSTSVELLPPPPPPPLVNQAKIPKNVPISIAQINQSVDQSINVAKIPKNLPLSLTQLEKMGNQLPPLPSISTPRPPTPRPESKTAHVDFLKPIQPVPFGSDLKTSSGRSDAATVKPKASLPPELIAINPQHNTQRKSIENVLKNIQQLAKNSMTPPSPVSTPSTSLQNLGFSPINPPSTSISMSITKQPETITTTIAPTSSTPVKKSKGSGKQWRPTLIPITDDEQSKNTRDVLYQTADGRKLPSLVQVMSGGKPYHITIQDYNKMCVMRREKLLHLQKSDKKKSGASKSGQTDPTKDTPSLTIVAQISNKPPSPETLLPVNLGDHPITLNMDDVKIPSAVTITKADDNDTILPPLIQPIPPTIDNDAASILKSVGLKNITITSVDDTKTSSPLTIQSSSLINTMESNPIMVTTDSAITTLAAITSMSLPITSQAVILPKIPKSLTVIPQLSVTSCSSTPVSITPSVAITTVTTPITNEPPELIPVSSISTPPPPQTEP